MQTSHVERCYAPGCVKFLSDVPQQFCLYRGLFCKPFSGPPCPVWHSHETWVVLAPLYDPWMLIYFESWVRTEGKEGVATADRSSRSVSRLSLTSFTTISRQSQRWAWGVSWRCCSLLIFFFTRCHPYFLINSLAHHKIVLPQVTGFVRKHASIKADFTLVVVWTHNSEGDLCPH